jgi:hypothetical protein
MTNSLSHTMQVWEGQDTMPTTLWTWNEAKQVTGNARRKYREFSNFLDVLTQHQVTLVAVIMVLDPSIFTISEANSIFNCLGLLVSLGFCPATGVPYSPGLARVRRVSVQCPTNFLPRGGDPLAHQGLQAVWQTYGRATTSVLHKPEAAQVHFHFETTVHLRCVCVTTKYGFVAGWTAG